MTDVPLRRLRDPATDAATVLRRHWLAAILITAGLVLRILAQIAYQPALLYVDTLKYLYSVYPNSDPVGYKVPLRLILLIGNLNTVTAVQHLLGLAIAVALYVILLRRGTPRWLAALAIAPILLDAYQLQIEQTIMPDVWFEALIVAGLAALLAVPAPGPAGGTVPKLAPSQGSSTAATLALDHASGAAATLARGQATGTTAATAPDAASDLATTPHASGLVGRSAAAVPVLGRTRSVRARLARANARSGMPAIITAGLVLGASATVRQVGEILILPALIYLVTLWGGWERVFTRSVALVAAFAIPVFGYSAGSLLISGHFWLAGATPSVTSYGRMAAAADCATLRLPAYERALCPTARQRAFGQDWLDHDIHSPFKAFVPPAGMNRFAVIAAFDHAVLAQQPQRVLAAVTGDAIKLFALTRTSSQGGTPISRWQFQDFYPTYPNWITTSHGRVIVGLPQADGSTKYQPLPASYGGTSQVDRPVAAALRRYQLDGGYTPGPLMLIFALAGLAGSLLVLRRRTSAARRRLTAACLLFFGGGVAVLAMSDVFQFSWRYQLPALVTLPPAGALGIAAIASYLHKRSAGRQAAEQHDAVPELAAPAV
jgi:hypothetical protein